jgi:hypothetical protein
MKIKKYYFGMYCDLGNYKINITHNRNQYNINFKNELDVLFRKLF